MTRLATFIAALGLLGTVVLAHGGHDHIRGTVTKIADQAVTVQVVAKGTTTLKTVTVTPKTTFQLAGKAAHLTDLKVGDRVVVEVPEGTTQADEIQIGDAPKAPAPAAKKAP